MNSAVKHGTRTLVALLMTAATAGAQGNDRVGWKVFPSLYVVSDSVVFELRERDFPNRIGYARRETKREGVSRHPSMHD